MIHDITLSLCLEEIERRELMSSALVLHRYRLWRSKARPWVQRSSSHWCLSSGISTVYTRAVFFLKRPEPYDMKRRGEVGRRDESGRTNKVAFKTSGIPLQCCSSIFGRPNMRILGV